MVKHIVMWKYVETLSCDEKKVLFSKLKAAAEDMKNKVPGLLGIELIDNKNPKEKYDLCLYCEFEKIEDVDHYQDHPLHVVFKNIISGNVTDRACIDG